MTTSLHLGKHSIIQKAPDRHQQNNSNCYLHFLKQGYLFLHWKAHLIMCFLLCHLVTNKSFRSSNIVLVYSCCHGPLLFWIFFFVTCLKNKITFSSLHSSITPVFAHHPSHSQIACCYCSLPPFTCTCSCGSIT